MFAKTRTIIVVVLAALLIATLFGATHTQAQSGDPTFGTPTISVDRTIYSFEPIDAMQVFPQGVQHLVGLVSVSGLPDGSSVDSQWYADGAAQGDKTSTKTDAKTDILSSRWTDPAGLAAGNWEIRFSYKGTVVAKATAKIKAGAFVYPIHFGDDCGYYSYDLVNQRTAFDAKPLNIAANIRYTNLPKDSKLEIQWFLEGTDIFETSDTFTGTSSTCAYINKTGGLSSGNYEIKIILNSQVLRSDQFTVGS